MIFIQNCLCRQDTNFHIQLVQILHFEFRISYSESLYRISYIEYIEYAFLLLGFQKCSLLSKRNIHCMQMYAFKDNLQIKIEITHFFTQSMSITFPLVRVTIHLPLEKVPKWKSDVQSTEMQFLLQISPGTWGLRTSRSWREQIQPPLL